MKKTFAFFIFIFVFPLLAQNWEKSIDAGLNLALNNYSENWTGGEQGSIIWAFNLNGMAQKQLNPKMNSKTTLKLQFGQTHSQDEVTNHWGVPKKSTDLIDLESVMRFTFGSFVDPFAAVHLESQFYDASVADNKRLFNPMRFSESAGIARVIMKKEKTEWTARLGWAFRQFIDRDAISAPSTDKKTITANDGGVEFVSEMRAPIVKEKIDYTGKLTVFNAIFYSKSDEAPNDYWKSPDINFENIFNASITKYLMVNLYIQMLYDKEISLKGRHKETLGLGLTYKVY